MPENEEPTFRFDITADVTDTTGETRSGNRDVVVGYTALQASLTAESWQTKDVPVELRVKTQTLNGDDEQAEGKLSIYRLKQPEQFECFGPENPLRIAGRAEFTGVKSSIFLEIEGAAHYLPAYAGNLDIMTSAALRICSSVTWL